MTKLEKIQAAAFQATEDAPIDSDAETRLCALECQIAAIIAEPDDSSKGLGQATTRKVRTA